MLNYTNKSFKDIELIKGEIYTIGWMGSQTSVATYKVLDYGVEEVTEPYKKECLRLNLEYMDGKRTREVKLPKGITLFICKGEYDLDVEMLASEQDRIHTNVNYWLIFEDFVRYLISQVNQEDMVYAQVEMGKINRSEKSKEDGVVTILVRSCLRNEWWYNALVGMILRVNELESNSNYYYLVNNPLKIHKTDAIEINV